MSTNIYHSDYNIFLPNPGLCIDMLSILARCAKSVGDQNYKPLVSLYKAKVGGVAGLSRWYSLDPLLTTTEREIELRKNYISYEYMLDWTNYSEPRDEQQSTTATASSDES